MIIYTLFDKEKNQYIANELDYTYDPWGYSNQRKIKHTKTYLTSSHDRSINDAKDRKHNIVSTIVADTPEKIQAKVVKVHLEKNIVIKKIRLRKVEEIECPC